MLLKHWEIKMDRILLSIAGAALLIGSSVNANLPTSNNDGCLEGPLAQFGQYLGSWKITDSQLKSDGSGWDPGAGARWDWFYLGDGVAVQDIWMPNGGGTGTTCAPTTRQRKAGKFFRLSKVWTAISSSLPNTIRTVARR